MAVYASAQDGLAGLEPEFDRRLKYTDFIDCYARLNEDEWLCYQREYLAGSTQREVIMGMLNYSRQEGRQQGLQQGISVGEAILLKRLLTRRFGPLPEWAASRLAKADQASLEAWTDRVLDAPDLAAVFVETGKE